MRLLLLALLLFCSLFTYAQQTDVQVGEQVLVKMYNGAEYIGIYEGVVDGNIILITANGEVRLIAANVKRISANDYVGKYSYQHPHKTRYFFSPTAMPLGKGEGYYQNIMLGFNFVNYGITDYLSVGGGTELFSLLTGNPIILLTPKVAFEAGDNFHVGGGALVAIVPGSGSGTALFGTVTLGTSESNISANVGFGLGSGSSSPLVTVSGFQRVGRSVGLMTENYLLPTGIGDVNYVGAHGVRIISPKNAFDLGLAVIPGAFSLLGIPGIPVIGYSRKF